MESKIVIHHVGGRGGSMGLPLASAFKNDIITVLYEPDTECLEHMDTGANKRYASHITLPYCLDKDRENKNFNINYDPYTSSLLKLNETYDSYYTLGTETIYVDYIYGEVMKTMANIQINTITLDEVLMRSDVPSPDLLSLDTQGSEYDILEGGNNALSKVIAVISEVSFIPVYKEQKLFNDVMQLLLSKGFQFISFLSMAEASPWRAPIGARGKGQQVEGDAFFVKSLDQLRSDFSGEKFLLAATKQAFICLQLGYIELAMNIIIDSKAESFIKSQEPHAVAYLDFLKEFLLSMSAVKPLYLPTFKDKYTFEESKNRFKVKTMVTDKSKEITKGNIVIVSTRKKVQRRFFLRPLLAKVKRYFLYSPLERFFVKYGLWEIAFRLKKNRKMITS